MAKKIKDTKISPSGKVFIVATMNNTIVTITDSVGNVLFAGSSGKSGFKGSRKSTPYAASKATEEVAGKAYAAGLRDVSVVVKGPGMGRVSAIKSLKTVGLNVVSIVDQTPIPHNGCRPKNKRRI